MKRLASTMEARPLPTFGDYRRMRTPEPFGDRTDKKPETSPKTDKPAQDLMDSPISPAEDEANNE